MYIFKEVSNLILKNYSCGMKGFYVQLRDAFFLGHLSIAINCHLVTRSDFPEVRLTFLNGRDWDGAKESLLIALNNNIYPCRDRHFIFEMLKWNASLGMGILNGVEEVFLWNLLVAAGDSQSPKAGGDGLVEEVIWGIIWWLSCVWFHSRILICSD